MNTVLLHYFSINTHTERTKGNKAAFSNLCGLKTRGGNQEKNSHDVSKVCPKLRILSTQTKIYM